MIYDLYRLDSVIIIIKHEQSIHRWLGRRLENGYSKNSHLAYSILTKDHEVKFDFLLFYFRPAIDFFKSCLLNPCTNFIIHKHGVFMHSIDRWILCSLINVMNNHVILRCLKFTAFCINYCFVCAGKKSPSFLQFITLIIISRRKVSMYSFECNQLANILIPHSTMFTIRK